MENKFLIKIAYDSQWRLGIITEYTGKCMSQRIQLAKLAFVDIAGKARVMMVQANFPKKINFKFYKECFNCATYISNLAVVTLHGKTAMRNMHFHEAKLLYAQHSRIWEEAGRVSTEKNGKVGNRGTPMIFIGYAKNQAGDCYFMYNSSTWYIAEMRGIMWLHCMYCSKPEARDKVIVNP